MRALRCNRPNPGGRVGRDIGAVVRPVIGDIEDGVLVDLEVPARSDPHVEQMLDGAALPRGVVQLLDVICHEIARRQRALAHEHPAQSGVEGLRDGHEQVLLRRRHAVEVALA